MAASRVLMAVTLLFFVMLGAHARPRRPTYSDSYEYDDDSDEGDYYYEDTSSEEQYYNNQGKMSKGRGRAIGDIVMVGGNIGKMLNGMPYNPEEEPRLSKFILPNGKLFQEAVIGDGGQIGSYVPPPSYYSPYG